MNFISCMGCDKEYRALVNGVSYRSPCSLVDYKPPLSDASKRPACDSVQTSTAKNYSEEAKIKNC